MGEVRSQKGRKENKFLNGRLNTFSKSVITLGLELNY
jgi:hypothetical protein